MLSNQLLQLAGALGAALAIATPVNAAPLAPTQMPKSTFDGAHTFTNWNPSSVDRVRTIEIQTASLASWYGPGFHGRRTASGSIFNQYAMTAAHKSLPFGTRVKVTNLNNGKSVVVRITDDGPHVPGRVIDLSKGAAAQIGMLSSGVAPVKLQILR